MKKFLWKIGGEAGFGIMTVGLNFAKIAARSGYHTFDLTDYPSLIRGGHNTYEVLVSDEEVRSSKHPIDLLVCLNKETFEFHQDRLLESSLIVYDQETFTIEPAFKNLLNLPLKKILEEEGAPIIMLNNIALGASLALMGWDLKYLNEIFVEAFAKKGQEIVDKNIKVAKRGYDYIIQNYASLINKNFPAQAADPKIVITGNEAFSLGVIAANCGLFCAYPMTPASSTLTVLAAYAQKAGMVVRHSEDEIAVINTAIGSSWAGVRSAIATSGGGFALMVEGVSLAGMLETPLVIFLAQRPGPATGIPTWTEQGDLLFAVHAGHGDFPKIVLAPGGIQEMYDLTLRAFDYADCYQLPVIVLSDKFLSESHRSAPAEFFKQLPKNRPLNRGKITNNFKGQIYHRYALSDDGISPMLIPGQKGFFYQSNSYEHLEDGHTTEDAVERNKQVEKRALKIKTFLEKDFCAPVVYGDLEKAKTIFVSWGSNKGPILEALKELDDDYAYLHFTYLYPLLKEKILPFFKNNKKYLLIENNYSGQFGRLLQQETGVHLENKLLKYDGRQFWPQEIIEYVKR